MTATFERDPLLTMAEGAEIGVSDWLTIDQSMISGFGNLTRDIDPLHMDPEWARTNGPFGGTTAYGFLTMSLLTHLLRQVMVRDLRTVDDGLFLNYGFDRLRLVTPVKVDQRVRGRFVSGGSRADKGGRIVKTVHATIEIDGEDRPALVAEWLSAWVPPAVGGGTTV